MLCKRQRLDLLNPGNDTVTLGHTYATFTESTTRLGGAVSLDRTLSALSGKLGVLDALAGTTEQNAAKIIEIIARLDAITGDETT